MSANGSASVQITRKQVKNLTVRVCPPDGQVRVTAPMRMPDAVILAELDRRQQWITKWQLRLRGQIQPLAYTISTGERHYFQGQAYPLQLSTGARKPGVQLVSGMLAMQVRSTTTTAQRLRLLQDWYRQQLQALLPDLLARWQVVVGAQASECRIKRMKTRWGTCNPRARRIWLNLELIKYPPNCLDYVLVHELTHLHERLHNRRFWSLMDQFMPDWRSYRQLLNGNSSGQHDWHTLNAGHRPLDCR